MDSTCRRRTVALIAAYAVALRALLLVFGPPAFSMGAGRSGVLCTHDDNGQPDQQAPHDSPCAALGPDMAGALPPAIAIHVMTPVAVAAHIQVTESVRPHQRTHTVRVNLRAMP
jgi:hypothetical protein